MDKIRGHWYEYVPKLAETRHEVKVTILWNKQVQTDGTIHNNKPDIIIRDNEEGKYEGWQLFIYNWYKIHIDTCFEVLLSFTVVSSIVYNPLPAMWKS